MSLKKRLFLLAILLCAAASFGQPTLPDRAIHNLKTGRYFDDTSFVYLLPFEAGRKYFFIQGANSHWSHRNELSYDFKMKKGSLVCAARGGEVVNLRSDSDKGGLKEENLADGNFIIIRHDDGSQARYWHLQQGGVLLQIGDQVRAGQPIGRSGNTGYTAFPHLHFQVLDALGGELLVRFLTKKGLRYIRPGHWYKAVEAAAGGQKP